MVRAHVADTIGDVQIVPPTLVTMFNDFELELLISGLPEIDVDDWERHTVYTGGFDKDSPVVVVSLKMREREQERNVSNLSLHLQWFWEITRSLSQEDLAGLLQFATGCSRVPMHGFSKLPSAGGGLVCFTLSKLRCDRGSERLPSASTCFNLLKIPEYDSKEQLCERLLVAIRCGSQGFEFA